MRRLLLFTLVALASLGAATAQKTNIGYIFPAGASRGSSAIIEIGGQSIAAAKAVKISGEGITTEIIIPDSAELATATKKKKKISDEDNLQLAQKLRFRVTIDKGAELGMRDVKVVGAKGDISNRLFFEVGELPDFIESESNNSLTTACQINTLPVTINGYVEKSAVNGATESRGGDEPTEIGGQDYYSFPAKKGQTIVAQTTAQLFVPYLADAVPGWFQPVISLYNEAGEEVAYNDDYNLRPDPVIIYTIPESGRYTIKIHDSIYRGREDFVYRINLGELPFVTSLFPRGGEFGRNNKVAIKGVNLDKNQITLRPTNSDSYKSTYRYIANSKLSSNEITFATQSGKEEIIRPNGSVETMAIGENKVINSQILTAGEQHWYRLSVEPNEQWCIRLLGRRLLSPIDARMVIYNDKEEIIANIDDTPDPSEGMITHHADPELTYKFDKGGDYLIRITESQNKYGEEYSYRLTAERAKQDFALRIEPSSISIPQGGTALFTLFTESKNRFVNKIDLKFEGLPEGFKVSQDSLVFGTPIQKIAITAPNDAPLGKVNMTIYGESESDDGEPLRHKASPVEEMKQAFYISHLLTTQEFSVDVVERQPFTISFEPVEGDELRISNKEITPIRVRLHREEGFNEPVQIMSKHRTKGLYFPGITIEGDKSEGIIALNAKGWQPNYLGLQLMLLGTVRASSVKVAGQAKNTVISSVMVLSPFADLKLPANMNLKYTPPKYAPPQKPLTKEEQKKLNEKLRLERQAKRKEAIIKRENKASAKATTYTTTKKKKNEKLPRATL